VPSQTASSIAPITIKMKGYVFEKSKTLPRTSLQQEQHADGDQHRRAHQPAESCNVDTGKPVLFAILVPLPSAQPVTEHKNSQHNQQYRPELLNPPPREPVKVVQQQQNSDPDKSEMVRPVSPC